MRLERYRSARGAKAAIEAAAPNIQAEAASCPGGFRAVAVLRPDQHHLVDRLEERGIVVTTPEAWGALLELTEE